MNATQIERAAYIAARRIAEANTRAPELACPGARRPLAIGKIARIIKDVFQSQLAAGDEDRDCHELRARPELFLVRRRHTAVLIEFPRRALS